MRCGTRHLLGYYTRIVNEYGVDSRRAALFVERFKANEEFVELAGLARTLKKALAARDAGQTQPEG